MSPKAKLWTVPVGTEFDVRLQTPLNSGTAKVEQRFEATTIVDYHVGTYVVIPAGSTARGFVSSVRTAGKIDRRGSLTLSFDEIAHRQPFNEAARVGHAGPRRQDCDRTQPASAPAPSSAASSAAFSVAAKAR